MKTSRPLRNRGTAARSAAGPSGGCGRVRIPFRARLARWPYRWPGARGLPLSSPGRPVTLAKSIVRQSNPISLRQMRPVQAGKILGESLEPICSGAAGIFVR
jgi:hypothetical protein